MIVPDEVLFSVLIRAHGAAAGGPPWGDISSLLGRMKHTWGLPPSTVTYNTLLEICAATNDYERGCQARGGVRCSAACAMNAALTRGALARRVLRS